MSFDELVYGAVSKIPLGRVSTYKSVAKAVGLENAARAVGNSLNKNPYAPVVPCHRVVKSDGSVGGFAKGRREKIRLLEKEGVRVAGGRVVGFESVFYDLSSQ